MIVKESKQVFQSDRKEKVILFVFNSDFIF